MIRDPNKREQITRDNWAALKTGVDMVFRSGGVQPERDTDRWQECFSEACLGWTNGLNSYTSGRASPETYCMTCAKNQVRTWLRRTNRWSLHEISWETAFLNEESSEECEVGYAMPEDMYEGNQYNSTGKVLPLIHLWGDIKELDSPEKDYLFQEKLYKAHQHYTPIYKEADTIDRAIMNKIILAIRPMSDVGLAQYFKVSTPTIHRRRIRLLIKLRLED